VLSEDFNTPAKTKFPLSAVLLLTLIHTNSLLPVYGRLINVSPSYMSTLLDNSVVDGKEITQYHPLISLTLLTLKNVEPVWFSARTKEFGSHCIFGL